MVVTMAVPSSLRAFLARFRLLTNPLVLSSGVFLVLLGIFVWEYATHPEWFDTYSQEGDGPNQNVDLSGLTPEEQAEVANIDNLSLLFESSQDSTDASQAETFLSEENGDSDSLLNQLLAQSAPSTSEESLSDSDNPFAQYLEQYQFVGADNSGQTDGSSNPFADTTIGRRSQADATTGSGRNGLPALGQSQATTTSPEQAAVSPLAQALRQLSAGTSAGTTTTTSTVGASSQSSPQSAGEESATNAPTADGRNTFQDGTQGFPSRTVTIPGVASPFLPTTPQMSPPPGTTGYTPPPSFTPTTPGSGASNLAPTTGSGIPGLGSAGNLDLSAPQVDASAGFQTPSGTPSGSQPSAATPPATSPSPFSVPGPPGSYIGGGYINTFSNPSAPRQEYPYGQSQ